MADGSESILHAFDASIFLHVLVVGSFGSGMGGGSMEAVVEQMTPLDFMRACPPSSFCKGAIRCIALLLKSSNLPSLNLMLSI